jgi:hypothetical protein
LFILCFFGGLETLNEHFNKNDVGRRVAGSCFWNFMLTGNSGSKSKMASQKLRCHQVETKAGNWEIQLEYLVDLLVIQPG